MGIVIIEYPLDLNMLYVSGGGGLDLWKKSEYCVSHTLIVSRQEISLKRKFYQFNSVN